MESSALRPIARRAYEAGRLRAKLPTALLAVPFVAIGWHQCGGGRPLLGIGAALAVTLVIAAWRGGAAERAISHGLLAGSTGFLLPILACHIGVCTAGPSRELLTLCVGGGFVIGLALALRALGLHDTTRAYLLSAGTIAILTAALGCFIAGLGGVAGVAVGLMVPTVPMLVRARMA